MMRFAPRPSRPATPGLPSACNISAPSSATNPQAAFRRPALAIKFLSPTNVSPSRNCILQNLGPLMGLGNRV